MFAQRRDPKIRDIEAVVQQVRPLEGVDEPASQDGLGFQFEIRDQAGRAFLELVPGIDGDIRGSLLHASQDLMQELDARFPGTALTITESLGEISSERGGINNGVNFHDDPRDQKINNLSLAREDWMIVRLNGRIRVK